MKNNSFGALIIPFRLSARHLLDDAVSSPRTASISSSAAADFQKTQPQPSLPRSSIPRAQVRNSSASVHTEEKSRLELYNMKLSVMAVLTNCIGFENGSYKLHCAGYEYIGDIASAKASDIASVSGITPSKFKKISAFLRKVNLNFEHNCDEWILWRASAPDEPDIAKMSGKPFLRLVI